MTDDGVLLSIVVPIYGNENSIDALVDALEQLTSQVVGVIECVFVVDASPDLSRDRLLDRLESQTGFRALVIEHSRNFGSFAAIRTGLEFGSGMYFGVMAADLQEPPELMITFLHTLQASDVQLVVGERRSRDGDKLRDRVAADAFWRLYRRYVLPEIPIGGVDVFACTREVRTRLLQFSESNSSLIGLLFWLGFRSTSIPYDRRPRADGGTSSWTLRKKVRYMTDSIYSFTDLPLRLLRAIGLIGLLTSLLCSIVVTVAWAQDAISVPGYTPLMLAMFIGTMMILSALGIVGSYVWRAYENTKGRPLSVVERVRHFDG